MWELLAKPYQICLLTRTSYINYINKYKHLLIFDVHWTVHRDIFLQ